MNEPIDNVSVVTVDDATTGRRLDAGVCSVGDDVVVTIGGGDRPHVGCVLLAVPSPKDGPEHSPSVSVLTIPPHKEESIARPVAEGVCRRLGKVTVVTAGVHEDAIDRAGIEVYLRLGGELTRAIIKHLADRG